MNASSDYDYERTFESFVVPPSEPIRELYTISFEKKETRPGAWNYNTVTIHKNNANGTVENVYTYERKYSSMFNTFEPFRQLRDGVWKDYALISSDYTRFEVVDLQAGVVIAQEPYPVVTQRQYDQWANSGWESFCEKHPVGSPLPNAAFCPVDFYVPDFNSRFTPDSPYRVFSHGERKFLYDEEELNAYSGEFALYSGCVWGDDSSYKLRYIDLSRISEGFVTSDERFGYIELANGSKPIRKSVFLEYERGEGFDLTVPVELHLNLKTGKAYPIDAQWDEDLD